jgi:hypothetical protein
VASLKLFCAGHGRLNLAKSPRWPLPIVADKPAHIQDATYKRCKALLNQALACSELADVQFISADGLAYGIRGHRSILSGVSAKFENMFRCCMLESRTGHVSVPAVARASFVGFLEWLYLGTTCMEIHLQYLYRLLPAESLSTLLPKREMLVSLQCTGIAVRF